MLVFNAENREQPFTDSRWIAGDLDWPSGVLGQRTLATRVRLRLRVTDASQGLTLRRLVLPPYLNLGPYSPQNEQ